MSSSIETELIECIHRVYHSLHDNYSKSLFFAFIRSHIAHNMGFLLEAMLHDEYALRSLPLLRLLKRNSTQQIDNFIICGANRTGKGALSILRHFGLKLVGFCEENEERFKELHGFYCDYPVIHPKQLHDYNDCQFIIAQFRNDAVACNQRLISYGVSPKTIYPILNVSETQYFDPSIVALQNKEIFADVGANTGETSICFSKMTKGSYENIYLFEPDQINIQRCKNNMRDMLNVEMHQTGLWSSAAQLSFNSLGNGSSMISEQGDSVIDVISLDEVLDGRPITFLKMDIEGAELEALKGAQKTIRRYKPHLAICVYHSIQDIIDIPLYILNLDLDYKLYIRHYSSYDCETVLHAFI